MRKIINYPDLTNFDIWKLYIDPNIYVRTPDGIERSGYNFIYSQDPGYFRKKFPLFCEKTVLVRAEFHKNSIEIRYSSEPLTFETLFNYLFYALFPGGLEDQKYLFISSMGCFNPFTSRKLENISYKGDDIILETKNTKLTHDHIDNIVKIETDLVNTRELVLDSLYNTIDYLWDLKIDLVPVERPYEFKSHLVIFNNKKH